MRVKKSKMPIIIGCTIVVLLIIMLVLQSSKNNKKADYSNMSKEERDEAIQETMNDLNLKKLSEMEERDRMEYYVTEFIEAVEYKNYEAAYEMLYDDFKKNYFPTISDFEEYAIQKFPSLISAKHTNIERNGDIYVLWVTISNPIASKNSKIEMNFVIKENDLDDFDLSFSLN